MAVGLKVGPSLGRTCLEEDADRKRQQCWVTVSLHSLSQKAELGVVPLRWSSLALWMYTVKTERSNATCLGFPR